MVEEIGATGNATNPYKLSDPGTVASKRQSYAGNITDLNNLLREIEYLEDYPVTNPRMKNIIHYLLVSYLNSIKEKRLSIVTFYFILQIFPILFLL